MILWKTYPHCGKLYIKIFQKSIDKCFLVCYNGSIKVKQRNYKMNPIKCKYADDPKMQQLREALENMLKEYDEAMQRVKKA